MSSCLDYKSKELIELAKEVGVESTPAFADKVGTLMDSLQMEDESVLPTLEQYNQYISDNKPKEIGKVDRPQGLMYAQCKLPALWKELFDDPYFIGSNGDVDFNKVNDMLPELMDMLGYRIPNEDKYSSLPLKVNGFLPSGSGGAIMLPAEITTISGSDFDIDHMYAIIKHLAKSAGKLQVEKYLDDTNSTSQERKLAYTNRLPEARRVRLSYKDRLQTIKDEISQAKIDNNDIKELKLKSKDLAEQWNDIQDEIESLDTPTLITVGMYKIIGITDLDVYKDGLKKEFEDIKKEYKAVNAQISELQAKGTAESERAGTSKLQSLYNQKAELYNQRQEEINNLISDEEFNKLSMPQQNTKGARDNERLDIFMGIYTNPYTAKDIMSPGGYETIRKIAGNINKNKTVPKDVFGMESMDALTIQNIQGRNLKGIAANHNSHASKRQYSNLKLSFPVLFDGKVLDSLNGTISESVSGEKRNITRNFAEILAASVDNGKDPLLASINYNQHTADVISLLLATGADIGTVFAFANQPIILKAVELVNLGEQRDLLTALKSIAKEMKVSSQFKEIEITDFNHKELIDMFNGSDNSVSQGKVLQNMIKYMIASKDFSNLIAASKSDTKGIGKFMEEGITLMRNTKKALTLKTITGTQEFLLNDDNKEVVDNEIYLDNNETDLSFAQEIHKNVLDNFGKNIIGKKASDFKDGLSDSMITDKNYKSLLINELGLGDVFSGGDNYKDNFKWWISKDGKDTHKFNDITNYGIETIEKFINELLKSYNVSTKDDIDYIFKQNPELSKIGNQQQYSRYLETIFPESKVKNIGFKGTNGSQYFSDSKEYADNYGGNVSQYIFNLKNPMYISNFNKKYDNKELKFTVGDELIADKYESSVNLLWELDEPLGRRFDEEFNNSDSIIGPEAGFEKHTTYYIKDISNIYKLGTKEDIDGFRQFVESNKSTKETIDQRFNNMFYKYGVKMPIDEVMSKIYPYINESFSGVKDIIEQQLGYSLTADEAKLVDQMLVQFHTSKFDWYANEDKNNIVKNLPNVIAALKADYSEFVQSDLVKPLFNALVVGKDISMGMNSITFDNTQTASDEQREDIKKAWASLSKPYAEQLLTERLLKDNLLTPEELVTLQLDGKSFNNLKAIQLFKKQDKFDNPEVQQFIQDYLFDRFANNLIRYSFFTTGLNFTPKSISSLIPISTYSNISYNGTSMTDLIYNIQNIGNIGTSTNEDINGVETTYAEIGSNAESFIDQFYKHMYNNQKFVPRVSYSQYDKTGDNNVTTVNDQQITIVSKETTNSELYEYKDDYLVAKNNYISVKTDGKFKLYKNVSSGSNGYLTFERVELLGVPKLVYEFDANNTGQSIIPGNNIETTNNEVVIPSKEEIKQREEECK